MDVEQGSGLGAGVPAVAGFCERLQESGWRRGGGVGHGIFVFALGIRNDSRIGDAGGGGIFAARSAARGYGKRREGGEESGAGIGAAGLLGGPGGAYGESAGGCEGVLWERRDSSERGPQGSARAVREIHDSRWSDF